jgi:hypothetical protein
MSGDAKESAAIDALAKATLEGKQTAGRMAQASCAAINALAIIAGTSTDARAISLALHGMADMLDALGTDSAHAQTLRDLVAEVQEHST